MKAKIEKRFQTHRMRGYVVRHPQGHLCGYLEIPKEHPAHGVAVAVMGRISPDITYTGTGIISGRWLVGFHTADYPQPVYKIMERVTAISAIMDEIGRA